MRDLLRFGRYPAMVVMTASGVARADVVAESLSIGRSAMGRTINVIAIGEADPDAIGRLRDERPALLIVAGFDASHTIGPETARAVADRLLAEHGDALATRTIYVLPLANPDGAAFRADADTPAMNWGRAPAPTDADNDRRFSEDPADDLNDDGLITMMRVKNPDPRFGLDVGQIIDPDEPRLMRAAEPSDGEVGEYAVLLEGFDNDGDGRINEDGYGGEAGGGVDIDMNFPSHWREFADGAGLYPLSRSESLAIVRWVQSRPNIAVVLTYGTRDNLINTPVAGKFGKDGKLPTGILDDDKAYHEHIGDAFKELTKITAAPKGNINGSFAHWAYADAGLWSFETTVWVRPDERKSDEDTDEDGDEPASEEEEEEEEKSEADVLRERGVPEEIVRFLEGTDSERAEMMAQAQSMSDSERAERMQMLQSLPEDVRQRVFQQFGGGGGGRPDGPGRGSRGRRGGGRGADKDDGSKHDDDKKWLALADERGEGFIEWTEVEHPQFGTVEVGGFVPGLKTTPPAEEVDGLIDEQSAFAVELLGMLPDLEVDQPVVESIGGGLWRVSIEARNPGYLPTASAMSVKARRIAPIIIALDPEQTLDREQFVTGQRHVRVSTIEGSGGTARGEWLIRADAGDEVNLVVRSAAYGDRAFIVRFGEGER